MQNVLKINKIDFSLSPNRLYSKFSRAKRTFVDTLGSFLKGLERESPLPRFGANFEPQIRCHGTKSASCATANPPLSGKIGGIVKGPAPVGTAAS